MGNVVVVGATADEVAVVSDLPEVEVVVVDEPSRLARELGDHVGAVVVGTRTTSPIALVQGVHRADPLVGVVLLTTPETDADVRRTALYSPDMPSALTVIEGGDPALPGRIAEAVEVGRKQRRHHGLLTAVNAGTEPSRPARLAPASLGALLDHAPFGVLVGDLEGRLVSWNRWAGDLLGLAVDASGEQLPSLFLDPVPLNAVFDLARVGQLSDSTPGVAVEGGDGTSLEVTAVPTRLEDGSDAVLVLMQDVTARRAAEASRDRLASQVGLLARVSESLAGTLDGEAALRQLAHEVVPTLGDWVSLQTYDGRGSFRRVAVHHNDPELDPLVQSAQAGLPTTTSDVTPSRRIARGEGPLLMPEVSAEMLAEMVPDPQVRAVVERLGVSSVIAVPLPGRGSMLGSMVLVNGPGSPAFTPQDLAVAVEVGRRAGVALETAGLYAQQREIAAGLQRSLLTDPPEPELGEIVVRYLAAAHEAQVGGDWYDAFEQADGSTVLVIGDVVGHDTRAAAAMGQLRALLRGIAYTTGVGPAGMLGRLDAAIEGLNVNTTATALVARISDPADEVEDGVTTVCWANAGHPPPIVVARDGGVTVLESEQADLLLGVIADTPRRERATRLSTGATLLLYTDGLVERRGRSIDEGIVDLTARVEEVADLPLPEMCDRLLTAMLPEDLDDDVALVALRLR